MDIREWYQRGRAVEVGGQQTRFWHDNWLGDCPLKIKFYRLFQITSEPDLEVAKARVNGQWLIQFRRELDETRRDEWDERQRYSFLRALTMYTGHLSVLESIQQDLYAN